MYDGAIRFAIAPYGLKQFSHSCESRDPVKMRQMGAHRATWHFRHSCESRNPVEKSSFNTAPGNRSGLEITSSQINDLMKISLTGFLRSQEWRAANSDPLDVTSAVHADSGFSVAIRFAIAPYNIEQLGHSCESRNPVKMRQMGAHRATQHFRHSCESRNPVDNSSVDSAPIEPMLPRNRARQRI